MLDGLPAPLRRTLWRVKHGLLARAHDAQLAEYYQGLLARILRSTRTALALDVGANTGQYARMLRRIGYDGPIVSFEPLPENVTRLRSEAARDPQWSIRAEAVGVRSGTARFHRARESVYSSLLPGNQFGSYLIGPAMATEEIVDVTVSRLDEVALPAASSIHLKVDTQGTDLAVVQGALGVLDRVTSLTIELGTMPLYEGQPSYIEALRELNALGFRLAGAYPVTRDRANRAVDVDFVFVQAG